MTSDQSDLGVQCEQPKAGLYMSPITMHTIIPLDKRACGQLKREFPAYVKGH